MFLANQIATPPIELPFFNSHQSQLGLYALLFLIHTVRGNRQNIAVIVFAYNNIDYQIANLALFWKVLGESLPQKVLKTFGSRSILQPI